MVKLHCHNSYINIQTHQQPHIYNRLLLLATSKWTSKLKHMKQPTLRLTDHSVCDINFTLCHFSDEDQRNGEYTTNGQDYSRSNQRNRQ